MRLFLGPLGQITAGTPETLLPSWKLPYPPLFLPDAPGRVPPLVIAVKTEPRLFFFRPLVAWRGGFFLFFLIFFPSHVLIGDFPIRTPFSPKLCYVLQVASKDCVLYVSDFSFRVYGLVSSRELL